MRAPGDQGRGRRCVSGRGNPAGTRGLSGPGTDTRGWSDAGTGQAKGGRDLGGCGLRPGECGLNSRRIEFRGEINFCGIREG